MKKLLIAGHFKNVQHLNGPEMYMQMLYNTVFSEYRINFVEYSANTQHTGFFRKFFGFAYSDHPKPLYTLGVFSLFLHFILFRPNIVHITGFERFTWVYLFLKRVCNFSIVYTCHGIAVSEDSLKSGIPASLKQRNMRFEGLLFQNANRVLVFSNVVPRLFKNHYAELAQNFVSVPPAIPKINSIPRGIHEINNGTLFYAGNPLRESAILEFIKSNVQILADMPITIVGAEIQETISGLSITYHPKMDRDHWLMQIQQHTIFIIPYPNETLSFAALEAMAHGCIPIVEKHCGIAEYITHGLNGFLFSLDVADSFASILAEFAFNSEKKLQLSAEAIKEYASLSALSDRNAIEHLYYQELDSNQG